MLTPYAWTVPGGVNNHIEALAERFTAQGHRVTIIAPSDDRLAVKAARERVREVLLGERDGLFADDEPYPRHFFAGGTFSVRHNRSVSYLSPPIDLLSNVDVVLENEEFDVLHIHEPFVPSLGWSAMNHAECPIVSTFHANSERFFWYWLGKPILKRVFPVFDGVIAVSPAARDTAARYFAGQFRVIPNGTDLTRFCPPGARRAGPLRVLFVGGDSRRKGLGVLLRALRHLSADVAALRARRLRQRRARREVRSPRARALRGAACAFAVASSTTSCPSSIRAPTSSAHPRSATSRSASSCSRRWPRARPCSPRTSTAIATWCTTAPRVSSCRPATRARWPPPSSGCCATTSCARPARRAASRACSATAGTSSPTR